MAKTHEPTRPTAARYLRVSTPVQASRSGLDRQRETVNAYADAHGLEIVGEYVDVASGAVAFRPGLRDLLAAVDAGAVDVVLVEDSGRLCREAAHCTALLDRLRRAGVVVQSTSPVVRAFEAELADLCDRTVADLLARGGGA